MNPFRGRSWKSARGRYRKPFRWTSARKRAFKAMRAGLARWKRGHGGGRKRGRRGRFSNAAWGTLRPGNRVEDMSKRGRFGRVGSDHGVGPRGEEVEVRWSGKRGMGPMVPVRRLRKISSKGRKYSGRKRRFTAKMRRAAMRNLKKARAARRCHRNPFGGAAQVLRRFENPWTRAKRRAAARKAWRKHRGSMLRAARSNIRKARRARGSRKHGSHRRRSHGSKRGRAAAARKGWRTRRMHRAKRRAAARRGRRRHRNPFQLTQFTYPRKGGMTKMEQNTAPAKRFSRRYENPFASRWIGGIGQHYMKAAVGGAAGAVGVTLGGALLKKTGLVDKLPGGNLAQAAILILLGRVLKGFNFRLGPLSMDLVGDAMSTIAASDVARGFLKDPVEKAFGVTLGDEITLDDDEGPLGSTEWYKADAPSFGDEYFADDDDLGSTERENVEAPAFG